MLLNFRPWKKILFIHGTKFGEILYYIPFSAIDALQWMGAVTMRVQTLILVEWKFACL